ncbi:polysaccharide deacetylase family protein [Acaryochloris marina]|uniref:polysaccharide deacetylase family protein n=1 Tax=Acaryochloris marina TaxID=155978 RepID=UPI001BAF50C6|nr:polysaccharide deacetylase family protein [Acaryochloris marina]QUY46000.1 polysaccharide deacetylase family protein [Acaryochloris marina S15]
MLQEKLSSRFTSQQYSWLVVAGLFLGITISLVVQTNPSQFFVTDFSQNVSAENANSPLVQTKSESGQPSIDLKQRHSYQFPEQFQGRTINRVTLQPHQKAIALTFDDGPWPKTTSKVLDILQEYNVQATFFVLGSNIPQYSDLLQRVALEGHAIGNHTWSHGYHNHSPALAQREIQRTAKAIEKYTGVKTSLFRPPGGFLNNGLVAEAQAQQQVTILWSVDDIYHGTVDEAVQNILQNATSGGIILMHDGGGDRELTIKALPQIITQLRQQGYQLVTIPQLLEMSAGQEMKVQ